MSIICEPPTTVFTRDACPGQSTRVNCVEPTENDEKPKSKVIPLALLCGCLSRAAVESFVDNAATAGFITVK